MTDVIFFLKRVAPQYVYLLLLSLTEVSHANEADESKELTFFSEAQKYDTRQNRYTLGLRYKSSITFQMEHHQIRNPGFDGSTKYAFQISAASNLKVAKKSTLTSLLGMASIQKNIPFGSISLSHVIDNLIAIKPYVATTPLYTEVPLPNGEQHLLKSSMGVSVNWYENYNWTTSLSREGQLALLESHQISGHTEKLHFPTFDITPSCLIRFEKSSKPNPFHFVPEKLIYMTFFLPLRFSNFHLWVLEFSPNISSGQFQRHNDKSLQYLAAFELDSSISTKDLCRICMQFSFHYETTNLSDSSDYLDENIQLLLSVSTKK